MTFAVGDVVFLRDHRRIKVTDYNEEDGILIGHPVTWITDIDQKWDSDVVIVTDDSEVTGTWNEDSAIMKV